MTPQQLYHIARFPATRPYQIVSFDPLLLCENTQKVLADCLTRVKPKRIAEVGSWLGYSAKFMAERAPDAEIFCIDTWRGEAGLRENPLLEGVIDNSFNWFCSNLWFLQHRVHPLKMDGVGGLRELHLAGMPPDLIFIDGNHEYEGAYGDIHISMRRFPNATLVLDDYGSQVQEAAEECAAKFQRTIQHNLNAGWIDP